MSCDCLLSDRSPNISCNLMVFVVVANLGFIRVSNIGFFAYAYFLHSLGKSFMHTIALKRIENNAISNYVYAK